ncbi:hypothetical protein J4573_46885 [Actinomadura barringtoniae]|uniref:Fenitrothion hydrolase n=1 Tax=Actinomadura barringtoniae TaxID=1427535 RepID=A0A939PLU4_9ACTN|nr:hypothetical protein [Actinomadura barringtoniae]MBO2454685.1 hypothetical protein [Actinomadura barringtoniae]
MHVLAHGLGGRTDLPMDAVTAIIGGGAAVAASFLALTAAWRRPRLSPDAGRPLPARIARVLDSRALTVTGRVLAFAATAFVLVVAVAGPGTDSRNLAPWALFVTFWVGLVPVSVLLGPVWRRVNPLRTLHAALCALTRTGAQGRRPLSKRLGYWPAAGWLTGFVWLELVAPHRSDPRLVGALICGYAALNVGLAWVYGRDWFTRCDGFEAYSSLMARLCPIGRRADGTLVLRTPLTGLMRVTGEAGLTAAACVLIGSTGFDGITRTTYWRDNVDPTSIVAGTLGLAAAIAGVAVLYVGALRVSAALTGDDPAELPGRFAATLLPIAFGYTLAHYFSFFMLEGQMTFILASDPFGTGLNLLGSTGYRVDYGLVSPTITAQVQVNAIVLGHIGATIAAHDLALRTQPPGRTLLGQLPIAAVMVALTCAGLFALLSG